MSKRENVMAQPLDIYGSLLETAEILSDPELMRALRQSLKDFQEGRIKTLAEVQRELGLLDAD